MAESTNIHSIMTAVIQDQDVDMALRALEQIHAPVTHLASAGGFLGRRNATLLVGLRDGEEEKVLKALQASCRQRVEYLAMPLEGYWMDVGQPKDYLTGGRHTRACVRPGVRARARVCMRARLLWGWSEAGAGRGRAVRGLGRTATGAGMGAQAWVWDACWGCELGPGAGAGQS